MQYFTQEFLDFFKNLKENNNKEWFDLHRKTYEVHVKKTFEVFVQDFISEIQSSEPELLVKAKDCIFRINRDIRFSADKTPYKTNRSAFVSKLGRKSGDYPGFYFQFSNDKLWLGGGAYQLSKEGLYKVRQEIVYNHNAFEKLYSDNEFKNHFGEILGEKNKILPAEFSKEAENEAYLFNKSFYYMTEIDAKLLLKEDLMETCLKYYQISKPLNEFISTSLG